MTAPVSQCQPMAARSRRFRPVAFMITAGVIGLGAIPMAIWTKQEAWLFGLFALCFFGG